MAKVYPKSFLRAFATLRILKLDRLSGVVRNIVPKQAAPGTIHWSLQLLQADLVAKPSCALCHWWRSSCDVGHLVALVPQLPKNLTGSPGDFQHLNVLRRAQQPRPRNGLGLVAHCSEQDEQMAVFLSEGRSLLKRVHFYAAWYRKVFGDIFGSCCHVH